MLKLFDIRNTFVVSSPLEIDLKSYCTPRFEIKLCHIFICSLEKYEWKITKPWGHCDQRCDGGIQTQEVICSYDETEKVSDEKCIDSTSAGEKPESKRICNIAACPGKLCFSKL